MEVGVTGMNKTNLYKERIDMQDQEQDAFVAALAKNFIGGICAIEYDSSTEKLSPVWFNNGFYRMLGINETKLDRFFDNIRLSVIPEDLPILDQGIRDIIADNGSVEFEFRIVSNNGDLLWLRFRGNLFNRKDSKNVISGVLLDCTEQKTIEEEFKRQSDYMHLLMGEDITFDFNCRTDVCTLKMSSDGVLAHDRVIKDFSSDLTSIDISKEDLPRFKEMISSAMHHAHRDSLEFRSRGFFETGEDYRWYKVNVVSIFGQEGYVSHVIGHISDIHEAKLKEIELRLRADRDALTGLMNKMATQELIKKILKQYTSDNKLGALIMIDVDDFKNINDTYGHATGDAVLSRLGEILNHNFKGIDVTGRVGGDEFMVFMHNIRSDADAVYMADKIENLLISAYRDDPAGKDVSLSMGISICPTHGRTFEELYNAADKALYFIKEHGKSGYRLFDRKLADNEN